MSRQPHILSRPSLSRLIVLRTSRCLSGNTAEAIQKVDPQFIKAAKIEQSLTPGRNNGFLNMLQAIKKKAASLDAAARSASQSPTLEGSSTGGPVEATESYSDIIPDLDGKGPKYKAIVQALLMLKPSSLQLVDNSHQHAGHAGNDMDGESHFELAIVSTAFDGLNLVKRHKLVYMVLGDLMPQIHALQIQSLTPEEAVARGV